MLGPAKKLKKEKFLIHKKTTKQKTKQKWRKFIFEYFCGKARINWHNNKWSNHSLAHLFYESLDFTKWTPFWIVTFSFAISFSHQNSKSISNLPSFVDIFEKPQKSRNTTVTPITYIHACIHVYMYLMQFYSLFLDLAIIATETLGVPLLFALFKVPYVVIFTFICICL